MGAVTLIERMDRKLLATLLPEGVVDRAVARIRRPNLRRLLERPVELDVTTSVVRSHLDEIDARMSGSNADVNDAMTDLLTVLWSVKSASAPHVWRQVCAQCLAHPLRARIHEDPFAWRCFRKPRGYAGDAVLIDFLYTREFQRVEPGDRAPKVSPLGRRIFEFTRDIPAGHAVRRRRDLMAQIIDEVCARTERPHVLSVACGHLREATLSSSVSDGRHARFVALDQDELSLDVVEREVGAFGVTPVCASVKALFRGAVARERFDLIYSTGLYDYLDDRLATRLTDRMFEMLRPGGRLVIANFVPDLWCSAYMEAFLEWHLTYRNGEQMMAVSSTIPASEVAKRRTYVEENKNIVFLDIEKV